MGVRAVTGGVIMGSGSLQVATELVRHLHLKTHVDRPVASYSGETKGNLSIALALVEKPNTLIDE
jgi:ATP binding cassette subfamily A (ABC1) protein 13